MPWLRSGTVACAQNSTTVTGTGTGFDANARVGDAFLGPDGRWYEVTNIASATVMSILPAYLGATVTGGTYALAPMQGYVKESADALRAATRSFNDKLDGIADSVAQSTANATTAQQASASAQSSAQAASASQTAAAQSASDALASKNAAKTSETNAGSSATSAASSADAALASKNAAKTSETNASSSAAAAASSASSAAGATLGSKLTGFAAATFAALTANDTVLGAFQKLQGLADSLKTAAFAALTTSTTDTTVGRVLKVGDFGIGSDCIALTSSVSWDTLTTPGNYYIPLATGANVPSSGSNYFLTVVRSGGNIFKQIAIKQGNLAAYTRVAVNGNPFGAWDMSFSQANILGSVSQAGGLPTGAVIEQGSNVNGYYTKFADGTMICRKPIAGASASVPANGIQTFTQTFAAAFIDSNYVVRGLCSANVNADIFGAIYEYPVSSSTFTMLVRNGASAANTFALGYIAIGRWF